MDTSLRMDEQTIPNKVLYITENEIKMRTRYSKCHI
jgi:hypothetical protein